jgi:hypothetical protein
LQPLEDLTARGNNWVTRGRYLSFGVGRRQKGQVSMKTQSVRVLLVALLLGSVGSAQSLAELMQKAIYTEETLGDDAAAIRIYQQVIAGSLPGSDVRVHAQQRLRAAEARRRVAVRKPLGTFDGRTYRHTRTGLSFDVPVGWKVHGTGPSSDNGEMVTISAVDPAAYVAVWMIPEKNDSASIEERLDASPLEKVQQRQGFNEYQLREGSIQRVFINGRAAMVAVADYTVMDGTRAMAEYMTWIYTERTHTFFFTRVHADELERLRPQFDGLVYSAIIP